MFFTTKKERVMDEEDITVEEVAEKWLEWSLGLPNEKFTPEYQKSMALLKSCMDEIAKENGGKNFRDVVRDPKINYNTVLGETAKQVYLAFIKSIENSSTFG
jgi:hypothetical protein